MPLEEDKTLMKPTIMITNKLIDLIHKVREETRVKEDKVRVIFSSRMLVP